MSAPALAPAPAWLLGMGANRNGNGKGPAAPVGDRIPEGSRNVKLTSLAGTMRRRGMEEPEIAAALIEVNARRCDPPKPEDEVRRIAASVARYAPAAPAGTTTPGAAEGSPSQWASRRGPAPDDAEFTDTGFAARFAAIHAGRLRYVPKWGRWLAWTGSRWEEDDGGVHTIEMAKTVGRELLSEAGGTPDRARRDALLSAARSAFSATRIRAMVDLARGIEGIPVEPEQLDADPYLLGVENGVIDLRTGALRPAEPGDLMTKQCPVAWNPTATAPRFERALAEWFPDPELRAYVQRIVGAALVGAQKDHVFVIHFGPGGNGKGTFVRALLAVLGPYAVTPHMSLLVQLKHREHDTVKASLYRTRLAVASETERRVKLAEASVKNLTGNDRIRCRRLYENEWEFTPSHSLWLQSNYLPEIAGRDPGMWRRIRVVPWLATFERRPGDDLDVQLAAEGPGVLRWAVEGALQWAVHALEEPDAVVRATLQYRQAEDAFGRFAADTGLAFGAGLEVPESDLGQAWAEWSESEGIRSAKSEFIAWLREHGAERRQLRRDGTRRWYWQRAGFAAEEPGETHPVTSVTSSAATFPHNASRREVAGDVVTVVTTGASGENVAACEDAVLSATPPKVLAGGPRGPVERVDGLHLCTAGCGQPVGAPGITCAKCTSMVNVA